MPENIVIMVELGEAEGRNNVKRSPLASSSHIKNMQNIADTNIYFALFEQEEYKGDIFSYLAIKSDNALPFSGPIYEKAIDIIQKCFYHNSKIQTTEGCQINIVEGENKPFLYRVNIEIYLEKSKKLQTKEDAFNLFTQTAKELNILFDKPLELCEKNRFRTNRLIEDKRIKYSIGKCFYFKTFCLMPLQELRSIVHPECPNNFHFTSFVSYDTKIFRGSLKKLVDIMQRIHMETSLSSQQKLIKIFAANLVFLNSHSKEYFECYYSEIDNPDWMKEMII